MDIPQTTPPKAFETLQRKPDAVYLGIWTGKAIPEDQFVTLGRGAIKTLGLRHSFNSEFFKFVLDYGVEGATTPAVETAYDNREIPE